MRATLMLLTGVFLLMVSCQKEDLAGEQAYLENYDMVLSQAMDSFNDYSAPFEVPNQAKNQNANRVEKDLVFKYSRGEFGIVPNPGGCGDYSPPLQLVIEGGGIATHIGKFTVLNNACVGVDGTFLTPVYGFITAANGDVIYTVVTDSYPDMDNPPNVYYEYLIIGGSIGGRFEGATGHITMYGITDEETGLFDLVGWGKITY